MSASCFAEVHPVDTAGSAALVAGLEAMSHALVLDPRVIGVM